MNALLSHGMRPKRRIFGLLIVYPSLKTDFSQQKGGPSKDAFVRAPSWRSASSTESGSPATFPLLYEGRF